MYLIRGGCRWRLGLALLLAGALELKRQVRLAWCVTRFKLNLKLIKTLC